jgi:hypothetical protein
VVPPSYFFIKKQEGERAAEISISAFITREKQKFSKKIKK